MCPALAVYLYPAWMVLSKAKVKAGSTSGRNTMAYYLLYMKSTPNFFDGLYTRPSPCHPEGEARRISAFHWCSGTMYNSNPLLCHSERSEESLFLVLLAGS